MLLILLFRQINCNYLQSCAWAMLKNMYQWHGNVLQLIQTNWCKPKLESGKTDRKKKYFNWHACTRWLNCNELSTSCPVKMGPILLACGSPRAWITFRSQFYLWWEVGSPYSSGKSVNRIIKCCKSELDQTGFCNLASCIADQLQLFRLQAQWEAGRGDLMR